MAFRTDDPSVNIDTQAPAPKPTQATKPTPPPTQAPKPKESSTMKTDAQQRAQARIDIDRLDAAKRPKNNRDSRQDMIGRLTEQPEHAANQKDARQQMAARMRGEA